MTTPIFTRYLYVKEQVEIALLLSLLEKRTQCSLFWAFELYHSGFPRETIQIIKTIYSSIYEINNPKFKRYFNKKEKDWSNSSKEKQEQIVACLIYNLTKCDVSFQLTNDTIQNVISRENIEKWNTINSTNTPESKQRKLYVEVSLEEIKKYQTQTIVDNSLNKTVKSYQLLSTVTKEHPICESKWFSHFPFSFDETKIRDFYHYNWLYYASFSPLWRERIEKYRGSLNNTTQQVDFTDEDDLQEFYFHFGYEPDEQTKETQEKNIYTRL